MKSRIKNKLKYLFVKPKKAKSMDEIIASFKASGSEPWSVGYHEYKWKHIEGAIHSQDVLTQFENEQLPSGYGVGLDERVIEYPWLISHIQPGQGKFLDAGSTFNFGDILAHSVLADKDVYIYTYYPESNNFANKRISYVYGDLRELPFKDDCFDQVVCHSTLEHIDMDNSMYGYEISHLQDSQNKSFEYLNVIKELVRVAKPGGQILLTFPYGKFENHGFFQQFNSEMVQKIEVTVIATCMCNKSFAKYNQDGWKFVLQSESENAISFNPHTGRGKGEDNAAHSRAICLMKIQKNK